MSLLGYARRHAEKSGIKEKTRSTYRNMCDHLERYGDITMDSVTTEYIQGFVEHLRTRGLKPNTVRLLYQKLACVLNSAYREGLFDRRVLERVRKPCGDSARKCHLTETELRRMARTEMPGECGNVKRMFLFSALTGLRFSDVSALRWEDVRSDGGHLSLSFRQRKTGTRETLPLGGEAEAMLRAMGRGSGRVFRPETNQRANSVIRRWRRKAGIRKDVTFHTARHTFCVMLLTREVPIYTVQRLMCHTDLSTTRVYADIAGGAKRRAVKRLPEIGAAAAMGETKREKKREKLAI